MKQIYVCLTLLVSLLVAEKATAEQCVDLKNRTTPAGYVLTAAKCIGAMEQYGKMFGQDNSFFGSKKWHSNAAFMDKTCSYGNGKMSVADEAGFAKTNFAGYVLNKNMVEAKAVLSGCNNLLDTFMK
jgi:hypothetical protein